MFKKIITLCLCFFTSCNLSAQEMRTEHYPKLQTLSIEVPQNWETYDKQIFGIEAPNREVELAGTIYSAKGKTLADFTQYKHQTITKRMTWYKATSEPLSLDNAPYPTFIQTYEGVRPKRELPTTYIVATIAIDDYFLALTFTGTTLNIKKHRNMINTIIDSVQFKK